jgi:exosome complex component RRP42
LCSWKEKLWEGVKLYEESIGSSLMKEYMLKELKNGKRVDGRSFYEMREIEVRPGSYTKSCGEAWLSLGGTKVLVGISADIGEPFPDTPEKGVMVSNVELLPLASPSFEPGPPDENSIELARIVDRALRSSKYVDLDKLVIVPGKLVYLLFLDMYVLDHKGNLADALTLATVIALAKSKIPKVSLSSDGTPAVMNEQISVPVSDPVMNFTFVKIGDYILLDPNLDEEIASDAMITMAIDGQGRICSIQLRKGFFRDVEIKKMYEIAREKRKELMSVLEEVLRVGQETA